MWNNLLTPRRGDISGWSNGLDMKGILVSFHMSYQTPSRLPGKESCEAFFIILVAGEYSALSKFQYYGLSRLYNIMY